MGETVRGYYTVQDKSRSCPWSQAYFWIQSGMLTPLAELWRKDAWVHLTESLHFPRRWRCGSRNNGSDAHHQTKTSDPVAGGLCGYRLRVRMCSPLCADIFVLQNHLLSQPKLLLSPWTFVSILLSVQPIRLLIPTILSPAAHLISFYFTLSTMISAKMSSQGTKSESLSLNVIQSFFCSNAV